MEPKMEAHVSGNGSRSFPQDGFRQAIHDDDSSTAPSCSTNFRHTVSISSEEGSRTPEGRKCGVKETIHHPPDVLWSSRSCRRKSYTHAYGFWEHCQRMFGIDTTCTNGLNRSELLLRRAENERRSTNIWSHMNTRAYYTSPEEDNPDHSTYHTESPVRAIVSKEWASLSEFCNGAAASFVNIVITFPANKLMFRQQVEGLTALEALQSMKMDGITRLYRGIGPPLLQRSVSMSLMFGLYDQYYRYLKRHEILTSHYGVSTVAALLAGSTEAMLCPFERIQTILQHRNFTHEFGNTIDVAKKLYPYGFKEYYRGLSAILLRNGPSNVLFFTLRKPLRDLLPPAEENRVLWNMSRDFFSGAMLGALLSTTFFSLERGENSDASSIQ
eukprot:gb/GECG01010937.1/.p1 GENE.gb/GECG01010937.1/~~gb/GECG01010937.1/.p1  ORF type:complete len:385 (+),score=30.72 gb/GECG01010937.1/:1-1155(+)